MENILARTLAAILLVGALVTCQSDTTIAQPQHKQATDTLLNGQWYLRPVLASDTAAGKFPTITFDVAKGTFTGNTGCNQMSGSFKRTDSSLVFDERIQLSKMICPGFNEAAFLKTLLNTNRIKRDNDMLILMFDQTELSRWTRKPYRAPVSKRT